VRYDSLLFHPVISAVQSSSQSPISLSPLLDSQIISDFPEIFTEFQDKQFSLRWRGGRDGFGVSEFHHRRDDHANILTMILDTNGNIFSGFTPSEWESDALHSKVNNTQNSFLFTLKHSHNIPTRKFALKTEEK
jgi:hypothetical protein